MHFARQMSTRPPQVGSYEGDPEYRSKVNNQENGVRNGMRSRRIHMLTFTVVLFLTSLASISATDLSNFRIIK